MRRHPHRGIGGFSPTIATAIAGPKGADWLGVAVFTAVLCLVAAVAAVTARETHKVPTHALGAKPAEV